MDYRARSECLQGGATKIIVTPLSGIIRTREYRYEKCLWKKADSSFKLFAKTIFRSAFCLNFV